MASGRDGPSLCAVELAFCVCLAAVGVVDAALLCSAGRQASGTDLLAANITQWSTLQTMSINHVPKGDARVLVAGVSFLLYALFYVHTLSEVEALRHLQAALAHPVGWCPSRHGARHS